MNLSDYAVPQKQARSPAISGSRTALWLPTVSLLVFDRELAAIRRCNSEGALIPRQAQEPQQCPGQLLRIHHGNGPQPVGKILALTARAKAPKVWKLRTPNVQVWPWTRSRAVRVSEHGARGGE